MEQVEQQTIKPSLAYIIIAVMANKLPRGNERRRSKDSYAWPIS